MSVFRKHNTATTILFPLIDFGMTDFEDTPVTFAAGDTQVSVDEGAFADTTNDPVHEGNGIYSLALTAAELNGARVVVTVIDQTGPKEWEDQAIILETYGNASAEHAFDLDKATQDVNVVQVSGDAAAADNLEADYDGTGFSKSASAVGTVGALGATAKADVNAEVVDVIRVDAIPELGVGAPAATPTLANGVMLLYMLVRNKQEVTSSEQRIHNDGASVIAKAALSDAAGLFTQAKFVSGP